jgi:hypothetical protein
VVRYFPQNWENRPWGKYLKGTLSIPFAIVPNKVHIIHAERYSNVLRMLGTHRTNRPSMEW